MQRCINKPGLHLLFWKKFKFDVCGSSLLLVLSGVTTIRPFDIMVIYSDCETGLTIDATQNYRFKITLSQFFTNTAL